LNRRRTPDKKRTDQHKNVGGTTFIQGKEDSGKEGFPKKKKPGMLGGN